MELKPIMKGYTIVIIAIATINILSPSFCAQVHAENLGILQENLVPFPIYGSTVLRNGTVLVTQSGTSKIYKSIDGGKSLKYLSTLPRMACFQAMYCTSQGSILVSDAKRSYGGKIYRSANNGVSWSAVLTLGINETIWNFYEDSHGKIYASTYSMWTPSLGHAKLWRSIDDGKSWRLLAYFPQFRHIHAVFVNKYNGYIYLAVGDKAALMRSKDNGVSWANIHSKYLFAALNAKGDSNMVYAGRDGYPAIYRFRDYGGLSITLEKVYDNGGNRDWLWIKENIFWIQIVKGKLVFGEVAGQAGLPVVLGVSDANWNTFYKVLVRTSIKAWQGFPHATTSYWNINKIFVADTAQTTSRGTAFEPSS